MQKAVRRSRPDTATAILAQTVRQGRDDFLAALRRLPVICIEDAVPHEDLVFIVWLTAAMSRGWNPSARHINRVGHFLEDLAACPWRFPRCKISIERARNLTLPTSPLPVACMIRSCFGGTKGDLRLLRGVPWHLMVQPCPVLPRHALVMGLARYALPARHRIPEAVDFHCCPNMIRDIKRDLPHIHYTKAQLRHAIWHVRSGYTSKAIYMTKLKTPECVDASTHKRIFDEIAAYVHDYSEGQWARGCAAPKLGHKRITIYDYL